MGRSWTVMAHAFHQPITYWYRFWERARCTTAWAPRSAVVDLGAEEKSTVLATRGQ